MKKLFIALCFSLGFAGIATAQEAPKKELTQEQKAKVLRMQKVTGAEKAGRPVKADGTPDKRFKANKAVKKDGTPDKRFKANKVKSLNKVEKTKKLTSADAVPAA